MRALSEKRIQEQIGRRIRAAREAAGLTQEDAAHRARIDVKRWQRLESGAVNPTVRTLVRATNAVDGDFWTIFAAGE